MVIRHHASSPTDRPRDARAAFLALGVAIVILCWLSSFGSGAALAGSVVERVIINPPTPNPAPLRPEPAWLGPTVLGGAAVSGIYGAFALCRSGRTRLAALILAALGTVPLALLGSLLLGLGSL